MPKRGRTPLTDRPVYPRKRAVQACRTCRQRRTKCDNEQPSCTSCLRLGVECYYQARDKSAFDPASLTILSRLDDLETLIQSSNHHSTQAQSNENHISLSTCRVDDLATPSLARADAAVLYRLNTDAVLTWPVFGQHGVNFQDFDRQQIHLREPRVIGLVSSDLDVDKSARLLQTFVEHIHVYNPILVIEKVKSDIKTIQLNGLGWDAESCLLLLISALGSITSPFSDTSPGESPPLVYENFQKAESFFNAAQKRLWTCLSTNNLIDAQCFFLAGVYLMAIMKPLQAWRMFVQALACCKCISYSASNDGVNDEEMRLRESIYWTCFKSELELRLELGIPEDGFFDLTYPAFYPAPPKSLVAHGEPSWFYYLAEIALRRLGNRILNAVYHHDSSQAAISFTEIACDFEEQARSWKESLPPILHFDTGVDVCSGWSEHSALRFVLKGHLLDCYEMIYWPFVVDAIQGSVCMTSESDVFARKGFKICIQRIDDNESGFRFRHHGTWLMIRSCTRSALILLAAHLAGLKSYLDDNWKVSVAKVLHMLEFWESDCLDAGFYRRALNQLLLEVEN